jgi:hypothetical protein
MERPVEQCRNGRTAEVNTILDTTPQAGSPVMFLVTSFQFLPAPFVYHTFPIVGSRPDEALLDV